MGQYSSRLNVTTFRKERPSCLCSRTSSSYTPWGVDPVASPRTACVPCAARDRMREAISSAIPRLAAALDWCTVTGMRSEPRHEGEVEVSGVFCCVVMRGSSFSAFDATSPARLRNGSGGVRATFWRGRGILYFTSVPTWFGGQEDGKDRRVLV